MFSEEDIRICVIGSGYVGLTVGLCLADLGFKVTCADKDAGKVERLNRAELPIHEAGLDDLLSKTLKLGAITFTSDTAQAILKNNVIFIAVGTPSLDDGSADLSHVFDVAELFAGNLNEDKIVVLKSTVPIGTNKKLNEFIAGRNMSGRRFSVVSNPEFLRQGKALMDFISPHRIVIGSDDQKAIALMRKVHERVDAPVFVTSPENAEIIKYASNSFLAMKISYINEIANLCERYGADVMDVAKGMGLDPRIGGLFLQAGVGFGGSCFPKDMKALLHSAKEAEYDFKLLRAALEINEQQKNIAILKLKKYLGGLKGKTIGLWGLSFKPDTDDIREAPSLALISGLLGEGARIKAHDPKAEQRTREFFPQVTYCDDLYQAAEGCHGVVLVTEWREFRDIDLARIKGVLKRPLIIDGRNFFDPVRMQELGFEYEGVGR